MGLCTLDGMRRLHEETFYSCIAHDLPSDFKSRPMPAGDLLADLEREQGLI